MIEVLFTATVLELFIGGGGRLIEIGPATLRMVLFAMCLCASVFVGLMRRRSEGQMLALALVAGYLIVDVPGLLNGAVRGALPGDVIGEMQQSLYFLAAPFFAQVLESPAMVQRTARLVVLAGVILAVSYFFVLLGLVTGILDFAEVYVAMSSTGEFFFRGDSFFFYKGFLYLGIAVVFLLSVRARHWRPLVLLVAGALVMTLTRGFVLSASVAVLLLLVAQGRWRWAALAAVPIALAAFLVFFYFPTLDEAFLSQRDISNSQRFDDIAFMIENTTPGTVLLGQGFGSLINERLNIENTFLWVFWKLGLIGVLFWLLPLAICLCYYLRIPRHARRQGPASAFFFGTVLIYVQTQTNPYLNNPIGLSFVLLAIFSLRTLSRVSTSASSVAGGQRAGLPLQRLAGHGRRSSAPLADPPLR